MKKANEQMSNEQCWEPLPLLIAHCSFFIVSVSFAASLPLRTLSTTVRLPLVTLGVSFSMAIYLMGGLFFMEDRSYNVVMEQVTVELVELNKKVEKIIYILQEPENKFLKIMEIVGNIVGIIGILAIVDIIRNWILGG
jgi:hypothetical protein